MNILLFQLPATDFSFHGKINFRGGATGYIHVQYRPPAWLVKLSSLFLEDYMTQLLPNNLRPARLRSLYHLIGASFHIFDIIKISFSKVHAEGLFQRQM